MKKLKERAIFYLIGYFIGYLIVLGSKGMNVNRVFPINFGSLMIALLIGTTLYYSYAIVPLHTVAIRIMKYIILVAFLTLIVGLLCRYLRDIKGIDVMPFIGF